MDSDAPRVSGRVIDALLVARKGNRWHLYLLVLALVLLAHLLRLLIAPIDGGVQYVTFFPAVALAAVIGGLWAGLFAALIGVTLATFSFWPPYGSLVFELDRHMVVSNLVFLVDAVVVSSAIEAMHRFYRRYMIAERKLREEGARKNEFLAVLAHELRNPLAPIGNAVEILKLRASPDPAAEAARDIIDRQVQHLVRLVDDLLDLSRITRGRLELRRERVALAAVVERALEASRPAIERARQTLTVTLPPEPLYLDADPVRLAQVLVNLLNNACRYTAEGGRIALSAERDGAELRVKVSDNGRGIVPEHLPHLFEPFSRVDNSLDRSQGGLGIGLSLAQRLVAMHGGEIEARSDGAGRGSELTVRLPVLADTPGTPPAPAERGADRLDAGGRVLVADDNPDAVASLALLLRARRYQVQTACDGQAAVEAAARWRPDAVVLDIGMPKLDGHEACRRIRQQPWGRDMLIIALTGWGTDEDRRKTAEAGFDAHLVKPVEPSVLTGLLAERLKATA